LPEALFKSLKTTASFREITDRSSLSTLSSTSSKSTNLVRSEGEEFAEEFWSPLQYTQEEGLFLQVPSQHNHTLPSSTTTTTSSRRACRKRKILKYSLSSSAQYPLSTEQTPALKKQKTHHQLEESNLSGAAAAAAVLPPEYLPLNPENQQNNLYSNSSTSSLPMSARSTKKKSSTRSKNRSLTARDLQIPPAQTGTLTHDEESKILAEFDKMRQAMREQKLKIYEGSFAPENRTKNRYRDVLPIEETRVKLDPVDGDVHSDYINANIVQGEALVNVKEGERCTPTAQHYICCQAPLPNTFYDFWRMIWQYKCPVIVMLTKLEEKNRRKAHAYWPTNVGETRRFCDITVTLRSLKTPMANIVLRIIEVKRDPASSFLSSNQSSSHSSIDSSMSGSDSDSPPLFASTSSSPPPMPTMPAPGSTHIVSHLHYTEWPDFGIPNSTEVMRELIKELDIRKKTPKDPIVVHCSAGIGRAGTFLAIHISLQKHLTNPNLKISVKDTVLKLRQQRHGMVQSKDQYKFVYATLKEALQEKTTHAPLSSRGKKDNSCSNASGSSTGRDELAHSVGVQLTTSKSLVKLPKNQAANSAEKCSPLSSPTTTKRKKHNNSGKHNTKKSRTKRRTKKKIDKSDNDDEIHLQPPQQTTRQFRSASLSSLRAPKIPCFTDEKEKN